MAADGTAHIFRACGPDDNKQDGCAQCKGKEMIVVDEMLCFLVCKMQVLDPDTLVRLITTTYKIENIEASKKRLFNLCGTFRNVQHKGEKKDALHVKDMIKLLQERGTDVPTFVCRPDDLAKLPPITFDSIDVSALLSQMQKTQDEMALLKATMDSQSKVVKDLAAVNSGLDVRLTRMEKKYDDPFYRDNVLTQDNSEQTIPMSIAGNNKEGSCQQVDGKKTDGRGTWTEVMKRGRRDTAPVDKCQSRAKNTPTPQIPSAAPQPVQPRTGTSRKKKRQGVVGTVDTPDISTVKTKVVHMFATRFLPDLEAETLQVYLQKKLQIAVICRKIDTERKRFSSFQVTVECEDPKTLYDPNIWPNGAYVRRYYELRKHRGPGDPTGQGAEGGVGATTTEPAQTGNK